MNMLTAEGQQRFFFYMNLPQMPGLWVWIFPKAIVFRFSMQWSVAAALPSRVAPYGTILTQLNPLSSGLWKWDAQRDAVIGLAHSRYLTDREWTRSLRQQSQWEMRVILLATRKQDRLRITKLPCEGQGAVLSGHLLQRAVWGLTAAGLHFGHFWLVDADFSLLLSTSQLGWTDTGSPTWGSFHSLQLGEPNGHSEISSSEPWVGNEIMSSHRVRLNRQHLMIYPIWGKSEQKR